MLGEVSQLRQEQQALESELDEQAGRARQRHGQAGSREAPPGSRSAPRLQRALDVLRERLVSMYEAGSPDVLSVVLESETWSQASVRAEYLSRIQDYDNSVADRVKGLRDEAKAAVERMAAIRAQLKEARDEIAAKEQRSGRRPRRSRRPLRRTEGSPGPAPGRTSNRSSRAKRRSATTSRRSPNSSPPRARRSPTGTPAPLTPGQSAEYISESQASVPSAAPPAVQAAIEAANSIATTPYIWGGGHGSFESSGYDCSGAVSFALNGGGFLVQPARLDRAGDLGRPRPRSVDHRLRQRRTRLDDHRRPRLRHGRRPRPALAPRTRSTRPKGSSRGTRAGTRSQL